jgi:hypothetical protein
LSSRPGRRAAKTAAAPRRLLQLARLHGAAAARAFGLHRLIDAQLGVALAPGAAAAEEIGDNGGEWVDCVALAEEMSQASGCYEGALRGGTPRALRASGAAARIARCAARALASPSWAEACGVLAVMVVGLFFAGTRLASDAGADARGEALDEAADPLLELLDAGENAALAAALEEQADFLEACAPAAAAALEAEAAPARAAAARARRACSFVGCATAAGPTRAEGREMGLKTLKCPRCMTAHYCSAACQAADWLGGGHKEACAALRAEAAAAVARGAD